MAEVSTLLEGLPELDDMATDIESLIVLFALVQYARPAIIIEAGTYRGHFAVGCARMMPGSVVFTADPEPHDLPALPNLRPYTGDFEAMLAANPILRGRVGFAFIDSGDGVEAGMRQRHWDAAKAHLHQGGLLVCHDVNAAATWNSLGILAESLHLSGGRGLALWQKP